MTLFGQPIPENDTAPQWRSTGGKLLIQTCGACEKPFYYPRPLCPKCLSPDVRWLECSGRGEIYTYSVVRRGEPYVIAYVALEEGPKMLTSIVDTPINDIAIGKAVSVVFREVDGQAAPMFRVEA